jgi:dihydrofolate reductase
MSKLTFDITMSLDGYVAGPNMSREEGLGEGGEALHEWALETKTFQEMHGRAGDDSVTGVEDDILAAGFERIGAVIMGRRMFGGGEGPWGSDPSYGDPWNGWWGDEPPFGMPVFVLTHHEREQLTLADTTFTFVTDGIESALEQAREASGGKDVGIAGGAEAIQQYLAAGLVDDFMLHVAPMLLGEGTRLFDDAAIGEQGIERTEVVEGPVATHLRYRVVR